MDVVFVETTEWEGLYINGELINEGDAIPAREIVEAIGGDFISLSDKQDKQLFDAGCLPQKLSDLKRGKW